MVEKPAKAAHLILLQSGIRPESKIVIGVSGGPDSLALLHVMRDFVQPGCLWAAHLNHGLRPEADDEAAFVAQTADNWGLGYRGEKVNVAGLARRQGWSIEEAGRNARYQFLAQVSAEVQAEAVIVAHNADDQAETVLLNILRGTGLTGLRGMRPESALPGRPGVKLVRPFLRTTRAAIERYCQDQALQPVLDSTNEDKAYLRNRLRHELLPLLDVINPQVRLHLRQLADLAAADEAFLEVQSELVWEAILQERGGGWLSIDRDQWRALPLSMRRRTLRRAVLELRPDISDIPFQAVDLAEQIGMEKETGAEANLPGGVLLRLGYSELWLVVDLASIPYDQPQIPVSEPVSLSIPGSIVLAGDWQLTAEMADVGLSEVSANLDPWLAFFDVGSQSTLIVRSRRPGEQLQPLGMLGRSASIQNMMVNRKLPWSLRDRWPVVATEEHPLWVVGLQTDERGRVREDSRRIVQVLCHKRDDVKKSETAA